MTSLNIFPEYYPNATSRFMDVTKVYVLARADEEALRALVSPPLVKPVGDDRVILTWTRVGEVAGSTDMHYFDLRVPIAFENLSAVHCGIEYIDDDRGLVMGRELWGYPKRGAEFSWNETETTLRAEATREGAVIGRVSFTADSEAPYGEDIWPTTDFDIQVRRLPRIGKGKRYGEIIRADFNNMDVRSTTAGRAEVELLDGRPGDPLAQFQPIEVLAARMTRLDFDFETSQLLEQFFD